MNLRQKIIEVNYKSKACHIGSSLSCVEILEVIKEEKKEAEFIFGKASGICTWYCLNYETEKAIEFMKKYPLPSKEAGMIWSGGSLGMGLSVACGITLTGKQTIVLLSDGELQEGQTWEAIMFASHHKLDNLIILVDRNKLQALGNTEEIVKFEPLKEKFQAFNWAVAEIDGHDKSEIRKMLYYFRKVKGKPKCIICDTIKGKGVDFMENNYAWHYLNLDEKRYKEAILQLAD
jgi:transketolase